MSDKQTDFLEMLAQCQKNILGLCMLHACRQPSSIEDLYHEIVCNLWYSFPKFRHASKTSTWVYRIALNTIYMQYRTRRRMSRFIELDDKICEALAEECHNSAMEDLYELIAILDEEEQSVLLLYIDNVPQSDISEILNTTEVAINAKIKRLKQKLKKTE